MIWMRNLLFVSLVGGGLFTVGYQLIPPRSPKPVTRYDANAYSDPQFRDTVDQVDASFREQWSTAKVRPTRPAPDLLVARRLALGLVGTVPSLEEIRQLESEALPKEQRLPWWLDHLLQDRRFADYFAERLARTYVGAEDGPFLLYRRSRFVSWLEESLAQNRPYDVIVRDLIADDGLWTDKPATNFVSVTCQQDKQNQPDPVRLAGRVTRAFLGLRLDCAQCHNHPFAAWKKADFEGLSAFFGQTHVGFTGIYDGPGEYVVEDRKTQIERTVEPRVPFAPELLPDHGTRRQQLAVWVTHPQNPYFARAAVNRVWALLFSRPLVDPVDNLEQNETTPPALQILADDFSSHGYDLRRLIRLIASSEAFRLDSAADGGDGEAEVKAFAVFPLTELRPEQVAGGVQQAASVATLNAQSHLLLRLALYGQQNEFIKRYGDSGEDEFGGRAGTTPQSLLLMNGSLVHDKLVESPFNASTRIAWMAPDNPRAVETAYLAALTRRPTPAEEAHFEKALADDHLTRPQRVEDLSWALINSTEFLWNH
jgi:uncharacterized protein DUF1549/uncharacterized protein DUF1553